MKLKKFFAGVLAAAMMLTVGATAAFATTPATTYQDQSCLLYTSGGFRCPVFYYDGSGSGTGIVLKKLS